MEGREELQQEDNRELEQHVWEICWKCNGCGFELLDTTGKLICSACGGTGKLDWVSNILRKELYPWVNFTGISGYSGSVVTSSFGYTGTNSVTTGYFGYTGTSGSTGPIVSYHTSTSSSILETISRKIEQFQKRLKNFSLFGIVVFLTIVGVCIGVILQ